MPTTGYVLFDLSLKTIICLCNAICCEPEFIQCILTLLDLLTSAFASEVAEFLCCGLHSDLVMFTQCSPRIFGRLE